MGYSYWCSHLNLRIHIPKSQFHFPYSVTLGTKGLVISHLCTRVPFETATSSTRGKSLYPTFVVYLRTIHGPLSFISCHHPKVTFTEWIILLFKELLRSFPNCFTNLSQIFRSVKFFLNFFLRFETCILIVVRLKSFTNIRLIFQSTKFICVFFRFNFPSIFHHLLVSNLLQM
jgi:hypothetical protein